MKKKEMAYIQDQLYFIDNQFKNFSIDKNDNYMEGNVKCKYSYLFYYAVYSR